MEVELQTRNQAHQGFAFDICGKVIVAVNDSEVERLMNIYQRGQDNGVRCEVIDRERLCEIEPHTAGIKAIWVPDAGIVGYRDVAIRLAEKLIECGGKVVNNAFVRGIQKCNGEVVVETSAGDFHGDYMINCTGLFCDRVATKTGERPESKVVPFRGEYYDLKPESNSVVQLHLSYELGPYCFHFCLHLYKQHN